MSSCKDSSPFEGTWSGTFSGNDSGTWLVLIDSDGKVSGTAHSNSSNDYAVEGIVTSNGELSATLGTTSSGGQFSGVLDDNGMGSGTWSTPIWFITYDGTWIGSKQ